MERILEHERSAPIPPVGGTSLGWRLAVSTAVIITLVMGAVSFGQQRLAAGKDREIHQELLRISLAPLAVQLESAETLDTMNKAVIAFHDAYLDKGYPVHDVMLSDTSGNFLLSTASVNTQRNTDSVRAEVLVVSPLLAGGQGTLTVRKRIPDYEDAKQSSWWMWGTHFGVTVVTIFLFLTAVIYFQVTRPINRLVQEVKKMEMGYWRPIDVGDGAWEIRWLAWRFGNMVQEVRTSMIHLVEAERKAWLMTREASNSSEIEDGRILIEATKEISGKADPTAYRKLVSLCGKLESAGPDDSKAIEIAKSVWRKEVLEANQLGYHQLKARLENAALRCIRPDTFAELDKRRGELKENWGPWATNQRGILLRSLEDKGIPCVDVLHRVKHTAGVWTKMNGKGLDFDEVYDLFAFRIIVPTEADCYAVLGIMHQVFHPEVSRFKDYIAKPKDNGYRSLHTCVKAEDGPVFEVQIRSVAMNRQAERGDAAHWMYKKAGRDAERKYGKRRWWDRIWRRSVELAAP